MTTDLSLPDFKDQEIFLSDKEYAQKLSQKLDINIKAKEKWILKNTREYLIDALKQLKKYLPTENTIL